MLVRVAAGAKRYTVPDVCQRLHGTPQFLVPRVCSSFLYFDPEVLLLNEKDISGLQSCTRVHELEVEFPHKLRDEKAYLHESNVLAYASPGPETPLGCC